MVSGLAPGSEADTEIVGKSTCGSGATGSTNPEQLFAAGWSACFLGAMGVAAAQKQVTLPADRAVDAEVDLGTNAGGLCCVKYGVTTDYVLGLDVVLADGTLVVLGGKRIKDVAGLSLLALAVVAVPARAGGDFAAAEAKYRTYRKRPSLYKRTEGRLQLIATGDVRAFPILVGDYQKPEKPQDAPKHIERQRRGLHAGIAYQDR